MRKDSPQIVFAGGGTGGHLFPAFAVAEELRRRRPAARIWFIGARRGLEQRLVPAAGYSLRSLAISGIKGRGVAGKLSAGVAAAVALLRCLVWLGRARPDLVIGVGGYASGPAVLAATWLKLRTMVLEQNHYPGTTNRWLAPRVDRVCVPSEEARARLGGRGVVTGNPVRAAFSTITAAPGRPALSILVFGGSRGAQSINRALLEALTELAILDPPPEVLHQTGAGELSGEGRAQPDYPTGKYRAVEFIDDMPARLADADLVIARAGATTLAELAVAGRPSILIPYPFAADDHQRHNAETLRVAGAAEVILDADLDGPRLARCIGELGADRERLQRMAAAAQRAGRPDAAARIGDLAEQLLDGLVRGDHVS